MSNLQQQDRNNITTRGIKGDRNFYHPKFGSIPSTITSTATIPLQQLSLNAETMATTPAAGQMLHENYNLKWDEATLEQKFAALNLETQRQLLNGFVPQRAQMRNAGMAYPWEYHQRAPRAPSQRSRELYKTSLCDFWRAGLPCRFGERCWFAHGLHELRIARFVYPGLHPNDYEIRMNPYTTLSTTSYGQRFWNSEQQTYPIAATMQQLPLPMTNTPIVQNVPIGYQRTLRHISPVHQNTNSKSGHTTQQRASDGDSGIGSAGTNSSPEVNVKYVAY